MSRRARSPAAGISHHSGSISELPSAAGAADASDSITAGSMTKANGIALVSSPAGSTSSSPGARMVRNGPSKWRAMRWWPAASCDRRVGEHHVLQPDHPVHDQAQTRPIGRRSRSTSRPLFAGSASTSTHSSGSSVAETARAWLSNTSSVRSSRPSTNARAPISRRSAPAPGTNAPARRTARDRCREDAGPARGRR